MPFYCRTSIGSYSICSFNKDVCFIFSDTCTTIAFTASLSYNLINHHNKQVIFNTVATKAGSGYNTTTGIFTAPVEGNYFFIWHVETANIDNAYCYLYLYKNNNGLQFTANADSRGRNGGSDSGSNSAVLFLHEGDYVGIRTSACYYLHLSQAHLYITRLYP